MNSLKELDDLIDKIKTFIIYEEDKFNNELKKVNKKRIKKWIKK
jgi:hypothetical protein